MKKKFAQSSPAPEVPNASKLMNILQSVPLEGDARPKPNFLIDSPRNRELYPWLQLDKYQLHVVHFDAGVHAYCKENFARPVTRESHPDAPEEHFDAEGFFRVGPKLEMVMLFSLREQAAKLYEEQLKARTLASHDPTVAMVKA